MAEQEAGTGTAAAGTDSGLSSEGYGWMPDFEADVMPRRRPGLLARLRAWWGLRTLKVQPVGTAAIPVGLHEQINEVEQFRRDHGYSPAFAPAEATPEIAAHNGAVSAEYNEEVDRRKAALAAGDYTPRFVLPKLSEADERRLLRMMDDDARENLRATLSLRASAAIAQGRRLVTADEVMWDLEMSMLPGRRTDVTEGTGQPFLRPVTAETLAQADEIRNLQAKVTEREALGRERTVREIIGSRESILDACGGNELYADAVEANARRTFHVESLDEVPVRS